MSALPVAIRCSDITKSFPAGDGLVEVLRGIDFEVPAGELTMLVGLRIPAMIEIRVVLPQPDGPTS